MKTPKSVLVTGASTGIGSATAFYLAERGMRVYAGVRRAEDAEAFEKQDDVIPVRLDVTSADEIAAVISQIADDGGLWGLVNNAGVYMGGALELDRKSVV